MSTPDTTPGTPRSSRPRKCVATVDVVGGWCTPVNLRLIYVNLQVKEAPSTSLTHTHRRTLLTDYLFRPSLVKVLASSRRPVTTPGE